MASPSPSFRRVRHHSPALHYDLCGPTARQCDTIFRLFGRNQQRMSFFSSIIIHMCQYKIADSVYSCSTFLTLMDRFACSMKLVICCYLLLLCHRRTVVATGGLASTRDERAVLVSFKSLLSDPAGSLASWNASNHLCNWRGVRCSHRHSERVVALDMRSLGLAGRLAPALGNLSFLRSLDLSDNRLHGEIPPELGYLSRLQELNLTANALVGTIPAALGGCIRLTELSVASNLLEGEIPRGIGLLKKLSRLDLGQNSLSGLIPPSVANLSSLVYLRLTNNTISGTIPSFIGNLSNLQYLFLIFNSMSGPIPASLGRLSNLTIVELGFNSLSGTPPATIWNISSLVYLGLEQNYNISGTIPSDVGYTLPKLQWLNLYTNQFHGRLPASLGNASQLRIIQIDSNQFSGTIPREFGFLPNLRWLLLSNNLLEANTPEDWKFLPALTNCTKLQYLEVKKNRLSGTLPASISNFSASLIGLILGFNDISGNIPNDISNLVNLQNLHLADCNLTGTLPSSLGMLQNLVGLQIPSNYFSGQLPSSLANLTQLLYIFLGGNDLTGSIPRALGKLKSLVLLDLAGNQLSGSIPRELFNITTLSLGVDLDGNLFEGSIPFEVGNLQNLVELYLDSNRLSGPIPSSFAKCQLLQILYLSNNLLQGSIPMSFSELRALQVLDLSNNSLSGQIPAFFQNFRDLYYLNLSFNKLVGPVPIAGVFANASGLAVRGNEKLCGGIKELHLPHCPPHLPLQIHKRKLHEIEVVIPLVSAFLCLVLCIFLLVFRRRRDTSTNRSSRTLSLGRHTMISYSELARATDNFATSNLIGAGSFGSVYKGKLTSLSDSENSSFVAVKVLNLQNQGALRSFTTECNVMRNLHHRNLVKVISACSSIDHKGDDFKAIVFEMMPNGSLHDWLHPEFIDNVNPRRLNLLQRVDIAVDVASALEYLHHHGAMPVAHCDLKPSNILLDDNMVAHVTDFGIARILIEASSPSQESTSSVGWKGTTGYAAPEYGTGNRVSVHGDIYSYGIVLLEMLTAKGPTDSIFTDGLSLPKYVETALPDRMLEVIDPRLAQELAEQNDCYRPTIGECVASLLMLGLRCTEEVSANRMPARDTLKELQRVRGQLGKLLDRETTYGARR